MNIELTEQMQQEIIKQVSTRLIADLRTKINPKLIASQVKADAVSMIVSQIAGEFHKKANTEDIVAKVLADVERKVDKRVKMLLERGITIRFLEDN